MTDVLAIEDIRLWPQYNASGTVSHMPEARTIHAPTAPDNTGINSGNFSQACRVGDVVYVGGVLAIDQQRQVVVDDTPAEAMRQAFGNLVAILDAAGATPGDVVMLTALLTDLSHLDDLNEVQAEFFDEPWPPRSTVLIAGVPHGPVELTAVAHAGSGAG